MILSIKSLIVVGAVGVSVVVGAVTSFMTTETTYAMHGGIHHAREEQVAARPDGTFDYMDIPNIDWPMLTEDRYTNGEWTGPVVPFELPHASGECDPCN
jgi:hypothetical protein